MIAVRTLLRILQIHRLCDATSDASLDERVVHPCSVRSLRLALREPAERRPVPVQDAVHVQDVEARDEVVHELLPREGVRVLRAQPGDAVALREGDVEVANEHEPETPRLHQSALLQEQLVELAFPLVPRLGRALTRRVPPHVLAPVECIHVHQRPAALHLEDHDASFRIPFDLSCDSDVVRVFSVRDDSKVSLPAGCTVERRERCVLWFLLVPIGRILQGRDPFFVRVPGTDLLQADEIRELMSRDQIAEQR